MPILANHTHSTAQCRVCGVRAAEPLYHQSRFDVLRCRSCGTAFVEVTDPQLDYDAAERASAEGERYMREVFVERAAFWQRYWTKHLQKIEALQGHRGRLLDIGCAMGHFQLAAERRGWTSVGVEISSAQAAYARDVFGLQVVSSRFEDITLDPRSFDLVTLWGVIEHVPDPVQFLSRAREMLKPGGLLVLQTPNQDSLISALARLAYRLSGGRYLLPIYSSDHIYRFGAGGMRELLRLCGFEAVRITDFDDVRVMLVRMSIEPRSTLRRIAATSAHALAALTGKRNQLLVYARVPPEPQT